jgi:hypothetical protein
MTDRYKKIREALAMGPTPGPWSVRYDYVVQAKSFDEGRLVPISQPYGLRVDGSDLFANACLIAACDPDTIRAVLEERDALRDALETIAAYPYSRDQEMGATAMRKVARDALAQHQGEKHGDQ